MDTAFRSLLTSKPLVGIFGNGLSGEGVAHLCEKLHLPYEIIDERASSPVPHFERYGLCVFSPGFSPNHPWRREAEAANVSSVTELDFAASCFDNPVIAVTVKFKFPLVLPLAGRMVSWAANRSVGEGLEKFDYGHHEMTGGNNPGWAGQEVVMNASGNDEVRGDAHDSSRHTDGKYPFITLTETCVLPMPYSTARFPSNGFRRDSALSGDAVSDLIRGYEL